MATSDLLARWTPRLHGLLRIVTAFLFTAHGTQKLLNVPPLPPEYVGHVPTIGLLAGALELVGGLLVLVGAFTRPVAFVLSGEMAVAYFMAHAPKGFWPLVNEGELAVLYAFIFFYFAAAGGGAFSVDALRGKR